MKKRECLRIRLAKTKTIPEIEAMIQEIEKNPDSKIGETGLNILNKAAMKKLDEMSWAIYDISKKNKPEYVRESTEPEMKNW
jgi:hypothetical protein